MEPRLRKKKLVEAVLAGGGLGLALLLETLVPVGSLRELARRFGLSPEGFRIDKAPANVLARLLAKEREPSHLDQVVDLLLAQAAADGAAQPGTPDTATPTPPAEVAEPSALRLKAEELERVRTELERSREVTARALQRESELRQRGERMAEELARLRAEQDRSRRPGDGPPATSDSLSAQLRGLQHRLHDLEQEIAARDQQDEALRRQMAQDRSRLRDLEEENQELEALVPKGRRKRKVVEEPVVVPERRFHVPVFLPSFYKSAASLDRIAVQRAFDAVLTYCTYGPGYPGLQVKSMGGQDTWSMRAALGIRVYFRPLEDGDIEVLDVANREDQHTMLRRLKDR